MATFVWYGQHGSGNQEIRTNDIYANYGSSFGNAVATSAFQDSIHIESGGADQCSPHLINTKYVSSDEIQISGQGTETLTSGTIPASGECPIHVQFEHASAVTTSSVTFWADDGITATEAPSGVDFKAGSFGDATWTSITGTTTPLTVQGHTTVTSHQFYVFCSASPEEVGELTNFRLQLELTYQ